MTIAVRHVVVVTHRPPPEGWSPEPPFHFVDGVEAAVAKAQELAGDPIVEVAAGDAGGQALAAGLVDEVRMGRRTRFIRATGCSAERVGLKREEPRPKPGPFSFET